MISVILAGGVGRRFWPRSRRKTPKQLLDLTGKGSMIALTVERAGRLSRPDEIVIVTNARQVDAIAAEVGDKVVAKNIVGEPEGRNTAPSIGLAAVLIRERFGNEPFLVLPADHLIGDLERYLEAVRAAEAYVASNDDLLTFGMKPNRPETGYGYIHAQQELAREGDVELYKASSFHEKPDAERAAAFVDDGHYYWNSGMFCWRAETILGAIARHMPELSGVLADLAKAAGTPQFEAVFKSVYSNAPSTSIDFGVMEKADNVVVLKGDFYWNDLGSWESIRDLYPEDNDGNVAVGDHVIIDGAGNTIFSPDRMVGVVGVSDVVIVDAGDALLVCDRERAQDVREIVSSLKKKRREELY